MPEKQHMSGDNYMGPSKRDVSYRIPKDDEETPPPSPHIEPRFPRVPECVSDLPFHAWPTSNEEEQIHDETQLTETEK